MKMFIEKNKRKAVSPVLATVILIAITLIAAIAIAGFVFGLFGSFTSSAQVSAGVTSCTTANVGADLRCTLSVANTGTANAAIALNTCTINLGGKPVTGTNPATTFIAGTSGNVLACTLVGQGPNEPPVGSQ